MVRPALRAHGGLRMSVGLAVAFAGAFFAGCVVGAFSLLCWALWNEL